MPFTGTVKRYKQLKCEMFSKKGQAAHKITRNSSNSSFSLF